MVSEVGSVWRKWDLHVHTPFSALNNGYGIDWDVYVSNLLTTALANDIHVIGITDYFTIDGYKKLKNDYLNNPAKLATLPFNDEELDRISKILILPNIEFRLDILLPTKNSPNRLNFHVIFSDQVPIIEIEENFLHELNFVYEGRPQGTDETRKLKIVNLIELGKKLRSEQLQFKNDTDLFVGMTNVVVNDSQICEALNKSYFKDKYLLVVPADEDLNKVDWTGQGHNSRKTLIQKSDFLMASNPKTIDWGLGRKSDSIDQFISEFKSIKPCIWGSDSHNYEELFTKNKERLLWIKSDLSFDGLKQLILEPSRVYIGIEPEAKRNAELNIANCISRIKIDKVTETASNEEWFDKIDLKINSGLVAIIGNKGNGKTALADIIALCGNAKKPDNYSFLTTTRFNKAPEVKGKHFRAKALWANNTSNSVVLNDKPIEDNPERVNYIPQSFLERLCSPEVDQRLFEKELRKIIYSRIPIEKRLHKNSLEEIISYQTEVIRNNIEQTKSEIKLLNDTIVELEEQSKPEYAKRIDNEINALLAKVAIHTEKEPVIDEITESENHDRVNGFIDEEIAEYRSHLERVKDLINQAIEEREDLYVAISELEKSIQAFSSFRDGINKFINGQQSYLTLHKIDIDSIFSYKLDYSPLNNLLSEKIDRLSVLESQLSVVTDETQTIGDGYNEIDFNTKPTSLYKIESSLRASIDKIQKVLDQPAKEYQKFLDAHLVWERDLTSLLSDLTKLETTRDYLVTIHDNVLAYHYKTRQELTSHLFEQKREIIETYRELYQPILDFKNAYQKQLSSYRIDFDAAFELKGFVERFDSFINYGKAGSFYIKDSALIKINQLIETTDFNNGDSLTDFINYVLRYLQYDTRNPANHIPNNIQNQLKTNVKTQDVYNYLFNLEYLEPVFQLKLAGKEIVSLSPGERGALLLIFYLLLDNDNLPLIIDQPEENLDNQSIYNILVPFIKEAKQRRQVIIVTHNPNLAVVCDADQIIHVKIDKTNNHVVTCTTGSIEHPVLNELVIEVLEGTFPAFDTRNQRYDITRSRLR